MAKQSSLTRSGGSDLREELSAPVSLFSQFNREVEQMMDQFWRNWQNTSLALTRNFVPNIDIEDEGNHYLLKAKLPDILEEDIEISAENGVLTIAAEKSEKSKQQGSNIYSFGFGSFMHKFALPPFIRNEDIHATFENGVLSVSIPKPENVATPFRIGINKSKARKSSGQEQKEASAS